MKRIVSVVLILCCIGAYAIRVHYVNQNLDLPTKQEYKKGKVVAFEKDYNDSKEECIDGYTVQVLDSQLLSAKEFYKKYNLDNGMVADTEGMYYYLIKVSIGNVDNMDGVEKGIGLRLMPLVGVNHYNLIDEMAFELLNPKMPGINFSLKPGSTKEMILPYSIGMETDGKIEKIIKVPPKLQITEYPHRKLLSLK